ncbi:DUF1467 domain-containing protein [Rhodobacteraceae bacterium WD3A24]|nr:DUF1467 domain-containing protein [Rhodobacteraceae bacterium WD3A24]
MSITAAIVLFAVVWFMVLFIILPLGLKTQGESGDVTPGTPSSAPDEAQIWRKIKLVTLIAVILWAAIGGIILSGIVTMEHLDIFGRMDG